MPHRPVKDLVEFVGQKVLAPRSRGETLPASRTRRDLNQRLTAVYGQASPARPLPWLQKILEPVQAAVEALLPPTGSAAALEYALRRVEGALAALAPLLAAEAARSGSSPAKRKAACRNAARDAWIARMRARKTPLPWDEVYDEGVRLAAQRGWDMPSNVRALEEAHRRYLKRQRKAAHD
jgi:hypothetical protein